MTNAQAVLAHFREALSTIWWHRISVVKAFALLLVVSMAIVALTPRVYRAAANVLIVNGNSRNDPTLSSPDIPALATSTSVLAEVQKKLGLTVPLLTLKKGVTAKPPPFKSSVMRIEYSDSSRDRAAIIANAVADELATYYTHLSTTRFDDDLHSLDDELLKQKARIERLDASIRWASSTPSIAVQTSGDTTTGDQLNSVQTQRAIANAALQGDIAQAQAQALDSQTRLKIARHDALEADPVYKALQADAGSASAQLGEARSQYTENHPTLRALRAKVHTFGALLAHEEARAATMSQTFNSAGAAALLDQRKAEAVVSADRAKVAALDGEVARLSHQAAGEAPLALMRLEREAAMTEYRSIASHRESTLLDRGDALSLGSVVVVDRALGSQAQVVGIGTRRLSLIFVLMSIILAMGCAFLVEQLQPRLRRAAQIESLYGQPVVATLEGCR